MAISKIGSKALVDCSVAAVDIADNSITAAKLAGSIANAKLANSSITVNGTTVSLGASGSIPAVQWQAVITADGSTATSAVAGQGYFIDTTSNAHTINLPGSPSAGDTIAIKDYAGTFATNNLTIGRNGNNIQGVANNSLIDTNRASLTLVYVDATKGWLYAVESNVADLQNKEYVAATGGTITTSGDYKIHSFTGDGCFVVSCAGNPVGSSTVDYLVVAGGGSGGKSDTAGGAGGGGFRESKATGAPWTASPLATSTSLSVSSTGYPITVGAGGAAVPGPTCAGNSGSNSIFSSITSAGGGAGARDSQNGFPGGSGGGAGSTGAGGTGNTPPVSPSQGSNGGAGSGNIAPSYGTGGGGGATAIGGNGSSTAGGNGGAGATTSISASPVAYAGGGGGARDNSGPLATGGTGGGGTGGSNAVAATSGTTNRGGGGGGNAGEQGPSGAGGSGIVIIRYKFQ